MPVDPMDAVDSANDTPDKSAGTLNTWVALSVALLATFTGICQIKDSNIGQGMQQAQADKVDHWAFYQARNIRQEIAAATVVELRLSRPGARGAERAAVDSELQTYEALVADQAAKKDSVRKEAEEDQRTYDALNYRDDQFDLSDALIALAISLLALTALTHKRWLFAVAVVPMILGVLMGLAGLLGWHLHPDSITRLLS
jgi:hypothetical protein